MIVKVKFRYQLINIYTSLERTNLSRRTGVGFEFTVVLTHLSTNNIRKRRERKREGRPIRDLID